MKKLTVENLNAFIDSISIDNPQRGVKLPRNITYPEQRYIDFEAVIDRREEFKDLFRQNLIAFSKKKKGLPSDFIFCLGERTGDNTFKKWTNNVDDVDRFVAMSILTKLIVENELKTVMINGIEMEKFFVTVSDEEIKPVVVKEE